ncbi:hypothetical protein [Azospirillum argentinense]
MLGETWHVNPKRFIPGWAWTMVRLWRMSQGGMGVGHLPEGPRAMSQSTLMMDAFALMTEAEAKMRAEGESKPGVWTKRQIAEVRASVARANELYPDGPATGALLEAVLKSRQREE